MKYLWIIIAGLIASVLFNSEDMDIDFGKKSKLDYVSRSEDYRPWHNSDDWGNDEETMLEYRGRGSNGQYVSRGGSRGGRRSGY